MSRIIELLNAIRDNTAYDAIATGRVEAILKSIKNSSAYSATAQSRHEELLLAIKNGTTTTLTPQSRLEEILVAIANNTLSTYLAGKNLFNEKQWSAMEIVDSKNCLAFNGFFRTESGQKAGNPLVIKTGLEAGTYTVTGKFKKTTHFNALCVMSYQNARQALGEFPDNFEERSFTFTTNARMKYLYLDTGGSSSMGYCEEGTLKFETGSTATPYTPYCFGSEIEQAYVEAATALRG